VEPVRSPRNPRVAEAIRLHRARRRAETGRTLLEGPHLLAEAVSFGAALELVFVCQDDTTTADLAKAKGLSTVVVEQAVMKRVAGTQHPRGPVAVLAIPTSPVETGRSVIVGWGVGDPGNVGTLIRSAAAFRMGFVAGPGTADPWAPKVLRAGAGSHFRTTIERAPRLTSEALQERGYTVVAAVVRGGAAPSQLASVERCALLVGDESSGLPVEAVTAANLTITIPMPGETESLNAAVAGSLLAYEWWRRRAETNRLGRDGY
jgi:TrmH family RNA methyltransferase